MNKRMFAEIKSMLAFFEAGWVSEKELSEHLYMYYTNATIRLFLEAK